jgi:hypothetical protein
MKLDFKHTSTRVISENYPYGFNLRTVKTDWIEFNPKHGFRHLSQTINPKTGRANNPKKSTYYSVALLCINQDQHCKFWACGFNGENEMKTSYKHLSENFNLYTPSQMEYLYITALNFLSVHKQALVIYGGADSKNVQSILQNSFVKLAQCINSKGSLNLWGEILDLIDFEALNNTRKPNYNPFTIKQVSI